MFRYGLLLACSSCLLFASDVSAQGIPQVVQLPTFSFFTVSTTVSVPDSGAGFLGGVKRRSASRSSRGVPGLSGFPFAGRLFRNDSISSSASSSGAYVNANIIDHGGLFQNHLVEYAMVDDVRIHIGARRTGTAGNGDVAEQAADHDMSKDDVFGGSEADAQEQPD